MLENFSSTFFCSAWNINVPAPSEVFRHFESSLLTDFLTKWMSRVHANIFISIYTHRRKVLKNSVWKCCLYSLGYLSSQRFFQPFFQKNAIQILIDFTISTQRRSGASQHMTKTTIILICVYILF